MPVWVSAVQSNARSAMNTKAFKQSMRCKSSTRADDNEHGHSTTGMLFLRVRVVYTSVVFQF